MLRMPGAAGVVFQESKVEGAVQCSGALALYSAASKKGLPQVLCLAVPRPFA